MAETCSACGKSLTFTNRAHGEKPPICSSCYRSKADVLRNPKRAGFELLFGAALTSWLLLATVCVTVLLTKDLGWKAEVAIWIVAGGGLGGLLLQIAKWAKRHRDAR